MRVGFSTNNIGACQPLRPVNFGNNQKPQPKNSVEYEKQIADLQKECKINQIKYETACMFAARPESIDTFIKGKK